MTSLLLFCLATDALAEGAPNGPHRRPCAQFVERYCENVRMGEGRRLKCLAQHKAQLSPDCRTSLENMQAIYEYGQKQRAIMQAAMAKREAKEKAEAAKKGAPATPTQNGKPDGGK
ncbi:MAG: hypothetical protein ACJ8EL_20085 [Rhizomicrobium sp.]